MPRAKTTKKTAKNKKIVKEPIVRVRPTFPIVEELFEGLREMVTKEIDRLKSDSEKGSKFLTSVHKRIKELQVKVGRLSQTKKRSGHKNNANGGIMRKHHLAKILTDFLGVSKSTTLSRAEITKEVCHYICPREENREPTGERDLRRPDNKRFIDPDSKLKKLLVAGGWDPKRDPPLTFCTIQKYFAPLLLEPVELHVEEVVKPKKAAKKSKKAVKVKVAPKKGKKAKKVESESEEEMELSDEESD